MHQIAWTWEFFKFIGIHQWFQDLHSDDRSEPQPFPGTKPALRVSSHPRLWSPEVGFEVSIRQAQETEKRFHWLICKICEKYIVIPLMPLCIFSQLAASSQFGRLGVVLVFSIFFFFFSPAPGIQDLTVVTCFNASRNKSHIKSHASYHLCRQAPGPPSSEAVNFHKQKNLGGQTMYFLLSNQMSFSTWHGNPKKSSNTSVPQHTTVTCPRGGASFSRASACTKA